MGYDFHLGEDGPKLIEINTNAGGALINAVLAKAQKACCAPVESLFLPGGSSEHDVETAIVESFRREWRSAQKGSGPSTRTASSGRSAGDEGSDPIRTIAIVDADPEGQYLYPEFVLFQRLFQKHGIEAIITSPEQLRHADGRLWHGARPIDLVYNRLTDFGLEIPASAALRAAYMAGEVVVTPNPWAHAVFADKRNLVRLTDATLLRSWGISNDAIALLARAIPKTIEVTRDRGDALWSRRSSLFFKPVAGYGGRAAYRGDKITRRVWETILAGGYVAQDLVPPSTRTVIVDGERQSLKVDIRNYTYDGEVQLIAARLYQGQTTNMRTPGGGFAPVLGSGLVASDCCAPEGADPWCCRKE